VQHVFKCAELGFDQIHLFALSKSSEAASPASLLPNRSLNSTGALSNRAVAETTAFLWAIALVRLSDYSAPSS